VARRPLFNFYVSYCAPTPGRQALQHAKWLIDDPFNRDPGVVEERSQKGFIPARQASNSAKTGLR